VTAAAPDPRTAAARRLPPLGFLHYSGCRYWTASLLPALVGTTLAFWLRPPGFSFRWLPAIEFLIATVVFHAGFSFLQARFERRSTAAWPASRLLGIGVACIVVGCLLGLHVNHGLTLHRGVPGSIFIVYGLAVLFVGMLYVAPPFSFCRRAGGEIVIWEGLGMVPVLGAYLVQVGDLTRAVYLASLPLIVATALWVWTDELITRADDERQGRRTMVLLFGARFSGRCGVPALGALLCATLFLAVVRSAISPGALFALVPFGLALTIVPVAWKEYAGSRRLPIVRREAFLLHLATCIIIAAASLLARRG
jgi:1,4-dihydroxy-2-naphthoate octaprenyltransferase